uniref:Myosin binding protein C2 n=1 Tax=Scleropages formosus TaxID=113540 RepID=A0A8C9TR53_SCLFO
MALRNSTPVSEAAQDATELSGLFLEKPESVVAIAGEDPDKKLMVSLTFMPGKDMVFTAKVDSSSLQRKPTLKWLKGKWLDLGSKAGKHLQFKETYDRNTKVYTYEMKIVKVVPGDAGGYRCEASAKEKCDSCTFEVTVEGKTLMFIVISILHNFKLLNGCQQIHNCPYMLIFLSLAVSISQSCALFHSTRKKKEEPKEEIDVWELLKSAHPSDYEKIAFKYGITDLRGMLKRLKKMKAVEPTKCDAFLRKLDSAYSVDKDKRIVLSVEVVDPNAQVKWLKNGQEIKQSAKYIFESVGNKRTLTINKCSLADDAAYECVVGEDKCFTEVFVKEPPVTITKLLDDYHVVVGERVEFEVEVSEEGAHVKWMKDDVELSRNESHKYRFKKDGKRHWLIINEATLEDIGTYHIFTNGGHSKGDLEVEEKQLEVLQSIADLTVRSAEQAMFKCEVSDEKVTGKWYKDGVEVHPSKRVKIAHIGRIHRLTIDDVKPEDAGDYTFIPDGYALSLSAKLNFLEIKIDYVPRQDPPKIHLDTTGNMVSQNTIIVVAGNKLRLDVEITGEPAPTVCWMKGDNVRTANIVSWQRSPYTSLMTMFKSLLIVTFAFPLGSVTKPGLFPCSLSLCANKPFFLSPSDVPDPPEAVKCMSVGEDTATITWEPPKFDGGAPIKGYLMERKKKGSSRWTKLNFDFHTSTTYEAKRMIEGVLYEMRVFAVNGIGISQPSLNSKPFMPIAPTSEPTRLLVDDVGDSTCTLKWLPPERIGAGGLDGYVIEYCKEGDTEWVRANKDLVERNGYTVRGLPTGEKMNFRVMAVNVAGLSPPALLSQAVTIREIMGERSLGNHLSAGITVRLTAFRCVSSAAIFCHSLCQSILRSVCRKERFTRNRSLHSAVQNVPTEKPGPPVAVKITDVWGFNAALEWQTPKDTGNCDITGYMIQKADKKTMAWFTVYEHNRRTNCTVSDLVMGNEYLFRIFSENICGLSEDPGVSKGTAIIAKTGLQYKPSAYKEKDMNCSPKFTQPLMDRSVIAGYSTAITCSVRGNPKPKIIWMKNRVIIGEDPKFLMQNNQGVLTLNIRKASSFDGGTYSCRAVNELGQDEVECKLEIRGTRRRPFSTYVAADYLTLL